MENERLLLAPDEERQTLQEVNDLLANNEGVPRLVSASGESVELPHSAYEVLSEAVSNLSRGIPVEILPLHASLTTQQAAEILDISRPHLIKLLEDKELPHYMVGTHRRIKAEDVIVYRDSRDVKRRQALRDVIRESEDLGLYDEPEDE